MVTEIYFKIGNTVKVAGYKVKVNEIKNLYRDTGEFGQWNHPALEERIDDNLPEDLTIETKIHETLHAINDIYGIKLTHTQLNLLSVALHQLFNDNG